MTDAIPVTIIGGYLGAGKTTLVNHLLRHADGRRIAVAVNEFGALPIDQDLIVGAEGDVLTLAGGCICCTFGSDLVQGLIDLSTRADTIDHILIEASGVALPGAIAQSLSLVSGLALDTIVVVCDAETVRARASDIYLGDTIVRQLVDADIVLLNKADLAPALDAVIAWLPTFAPSATLVATTQGSVAPEILFGTGTAFDASAPRKAHGVAMLHTESFDIAHAVDADTLGAHLAARETGLVRAKGFVRDTKRGAQLLQVVGRRWSMTPSNDVRTACLVCIAHGRPIDRAAITAAIERTRR